MKSRALPIAVALGLGIVLCPLAGCDRDIGAVHAEKDAQGRTHVRVDGGKVDQKVDRVEKSLETAGREIKEGAQEVGNALERGAERVQAKVGPLAEAVLNDAEITARIKAKLLADPEVAGLHIDVDTLDGRVTLGGKVGSAEERAEAEKLARHTDGVTQVVNLLQVAGQPFLPPQTPG